MFKYLFSLSILLTLFACKSDGSKGVIKLNHNTLEGKWNIDSAKRNGNKTSLLQNGFFEFNNDKLTTNINTTGDTTTHVYQVEDLSVKSNNSIYNVISNNNDTMHLTTSISNFRLDLILIKE